MKAILLTVCLLLTAPITGDGPPPTSITTPASSALARGGRDAASGPAGATTIIKAPAQVSPGDLVILDASESDAKAFAWTVLPESAAGKFLAVERGTKAVFASGQPGQYTFVLATAAGDHVAVALVTVTVGVPTPQPPGPGPNPPQPPAPAGTRGVLILRESADTTPALARVLTGLRTGKAADYLRDKGHTLTILDDDAVGPDGKPAPLLDTFRAEFSGVALPALIVYDLATKRVLDKRVIADTTTADSVVEVIKATGG